MSDDADADPGLRHAATIVLLRESRGEIEVLMTRRAAELAFMGDAWVFPGGRLDATDLDPRMAARVLPSAREARSSGLAWMSGEPLDAATNLALHIAGCRETFEESAVLLARHRDGRPCSTIDVDRLAGLRDACAARAGAFLELLQREDLYLDLDPLVYWAHWITPPHYRQRYDTRFFVVPVPAGQQPRVDSTETVEHRWISPRESIRQATAGEMLMAPPTVSVLTDLQFAYEQYGELATMLAAERHRIVPPIMPKMLKLEGGNVIVLPWDPAFASVPGAECRVLDRYPPSLASQPSRRNLTIDPPRKAGTAPRNEATATRSDPNE